MKAFFLLSLLVTFSVQAQRHPHKPSPSNPSKPSYCEEWINKDEPRCQPAGHSSQKPPKYCEDWINADESICQTGTRPNSWHPAYCEEWIHADDAICKGAKPSYCEEWIHKDDEICQPTARRSPTPSPVETQAPSPSTHRQVTTSGNARADEAMCDAGYKDWCK